jgi:hypothetical protein
MPCCSLLVLLGLLVPPAQVHVASPLAASSEERDLSLGSVSGLSYGSYLGGGLRDRITAVADGGDGLVYVAGLTTSADFPVTTGATLSGFADVFVSCIDMAQGQLVWSTLLGGDDSNILLGESATGLVVSPDGAVTVVGWANSSDFPTTPGAYAPSQPGGVDGFVARLAGDGTLLWATFLGGSGEDRIVAVDLAPDGVVVTGRTFSSSFPTTPGAFDESFNSIFFTGDAFVARLSDDGGSLEWSTFLGGSLRDEGNAVRVDGSGAVLVAGLSGSADLPTTAGAYDPTYNGASGTETDAFVARLSSDGATLEWSTFVGGSGQEQALGLALDASGAPVIAGLTDGGGFPTTPGSLQPDYAGGATDGFVTRLMADGSALSWSTLLGGSAADEAAAVSVGAFGLVTVGGTTASRDLLVTADAWSSTLGGGTDAFVARLSSDGASLRHAGYFGGSADDQGLALVSDIHGAGLLAGETVSLDLDLTAGAVDATIGVGDVGEGLLACLVLPPWADAGFAKAGTGGIAPLLGGAGGLTVGSAGTLTLSRAPAVALCNLFVAFSAGHVPFKGGTLVPFPPALTLVLVTSPAGTLPLGWSSWPPGIPAGFELYFQYWIADAGASAGVSASNAVRGLQP